MTYSTVKDIEPTKKELLELGFSLMKFKTHPPKIKSLSEIENKLERNSITGELYLLPNEDMK